MFTVEQGMHPAAVETSQADVASMLVSATAILLLFLVPVFHQVLFPCVW